MFDPVDPKQRLPELEEGILRYWQEEDIFKRSLKQRSALSSDVLDGHGKQAHESFSFYDGPPFATGLPHYGHLLAGTIKDVIPRYQTMRGKYVERRFGWDCHGLPVENIIEKEQGITSHKQIEEMGVAAFNALCLSAVQRHTKEWRTVVERMGRFVDMDHDYRTMDPEYMESIWWVFAELWKKKLIYEGRKAMHICPRCATPLSNFEVTQGYQDIDDTATTWKFKLKGEKDTFVLAWTTTPWSTLSTMGLSIKPDAIYAKVRVGSERLIMVKNRVDVLLKGTEDYAVEEEFPGRKLVGREYEHIAPWYGSIPDVKENKRVYHIFAGDYVDPKEGTGIVTINGSYGEIDMEAAKKNGLPIVMDVDMSGHFTELAGPYAGMYVKEAEKKLIEDFLSRGLIWRKETYRHSYPHCWRCETPLLNYATTSWFVSVEKIKEDLLQTNAETEWVPEHVRDGRFGKWLEGARDWAISRNRYWGTPLPIWRTERGKEGKEGKEGKGSEEVEVIASRDDLMVHCKIRFTKVTALRHAESEGNLIPIYQGKTPGTNLTDRGKEQVKTAAAFIANDEVEAIYCSPLARARQTAEIIAKETGASVVVDERLREVSFGDYEGKTVDYSDLTLVKARRAHKLEKGTPESIYHFPGMETWSAVHERIKSFLHDTLPLHRGAHIVIVTHADPLQTIRHFFSQEDPVKLSHQPYPRYAEPFTFFWDHDTKAQLDLHKHIVDDVTWGGSPSEEKEVRLTFVRHGETDWNKQRKLQGGNGDVPLNEAGRKQAHDLAKKLKRRKFDAIVSSDLSRTVETAQILSQELGISHAASWEVLRERHQGDWSGRSTDEIRKEFSIPQGVSISFHQGNPPNGETRAQFLARVERALGELLQAFTGKHVLLVGHGGVFRALQSILEHVPPEETRSLSQNAETCDMTYRSSPDVLLTLVRHGQTDWNAQEKVQGGNVDIPLNETGRDQIRSLAKKLKKRKFDFIISSDLKRAVETADILSKELKVPHMGQWKELRERDTGKWSGTPEENCRTALPQGLVANPGFFTGTPPGGESFDAFLQRLQVTLERIRSEFPGKRVIIACHGGTLRALQTLIENLSFAEAVSIDPKNAEAVELSLPALMRRIPEVLDCWFESGSMPYAQSNFPFSFQSSLNRTSIPRPLPPQEEGENNHKQQTFPLSRGEGARGRGMPPGFPADFIAEGMDQTRGWFYTLMILSTALYRRPAFRHCIVNGIVLAEDGRKMSKRLKNYPEPMDVVNRHGADAVRFTLMASPAVKGEDLRFSERLVEETVRSVLLPLWNVYGFFVTYANAATFEPAGSRRHSRHPLDRYIRAEVQDLVNRMTRELDAYDLSGACAEIHDTIDALTNWYVRLSRRRFAGKGAVDEEDVSPAAELEGHEEERLDALATLEDVLLTVCQVLAPFCPYITDAITLNLVPEEHGSVHLTDWPEPRELTAEEHSLIARNRLLREIVSLGHAVRAGKKIKVRQPLARAVVALPPALTAIALTEEDRTLLMNELNVKDLEFTDDPGSLAKPVALVDARKVGPRLPARVQELIRAGKAGDFTVRDDGSVLILDEVLSPAEVQLVYRGAEGQDTAADHGIVVSMETEISDDLKCEGCARDLIRAVQKLRKEAGYAFTDRIALSIDGMPETMKEHGEAITQETNAVLQKNDGMPQTVEIDGKTVTVRLAKI